jgi:hypothetical protein
LLDETEAVLPEAHAGFDVSRADRRVVDLHPPCFQRRQRRAAR